MKNHVAHYEVLYTITLCIMSDCTVVPYHRTSVFLPLLTMIISISRAFPPRKAHMEKENLLIVPRTSYLAGQA